MMLLITASTFFLLLFSTTTLAKNTHNSRSRRHTSSPLPADHTLNKRSSTPAGWAAYIGPGNDGGGCYVDSETRLLTTKIITSTSISTQSCLSACGAAGYTYAGLEYGQECWVCVQYPHYLSWILTSSCSAETIPRLPCPTPHLRIAHTAVQVISAVQDIDSIYTNTPPPKTQLQHRQHGHTRAVSRMEVQELSRGIRIVMGT
jgi:hypothetical protein